ncbi:MarR family winged helix-turn-helix transcriptional regulator [Roseiterribacter gracilis]|uniref:MarR family transcriptional regulator n=1 Tax=Roseiterribacter gracilis TaxID=2812848 RepID=A0A8S8XH06_9PROT|nr:MarR family transcriptional regulator [Rhodospirillales bacterium TMPK1]
MHAPATPPPLARDLGFRLFDLSRALRRRFLALAKTDGTALSRVDFQALFHIERNEGLSQTRLAQLLEIEPVTLVKQLDRLQQAGLIERRDHPSDRRAHALYLTDAAAPLLDRMHAIGQRVHEEALAELNPDEQAILSRLLLRVRETIHQTPDVEGSL